MASNTVFRINNWTVEPELNLISKGEKRTRIPPKFMQVLVALAERPGHLVTRTELLSRVWGDTVVVEAVVTRAVSELRRLLSTPGINRPIIETIPKAGYRLVAPITKVAPPSSIGHSRKLGRPRGMVWIAGLSTATVMVLLLAGLLNRDLRKFSFGIERLRPVTSFQGEEYDPVLSPDGATLAFVMGHRVFLKDVAGPAYRRLTEDRAVEASPAWSPDGLRVAYLRCTDDRSAIFVSPASAPYPEAVTDLDPSACRLGSALDWSPDGSMLAFADVLPNASGMAIYVLEIKSGLRRRVSTPERAFENHRDPVFSADGSTIAFTSGGTNGAELWTVDARGTSATLVAKGFGSIEGLDWFPDGRRLVFASAGALWRVDDSGGAPESILADALYNTQPSFAEKGDQLAFVRTQFDVNIRQIRIASGAVGDPEPFFESTHIDGDPRISPEGRRVAFISDADGSCSLWIGHLDGTPANQVVELAPSCMEMPNARWSPDGTHLALTLNREGNDDIFIISTATGRLTRVTSDKSDEWMPSWSYSGKALYFSSNRTGRPEVWRIGLDDRKLDQITTSGGTAGLEYGDGKTLLFSKPDAKGIWAVPIAGAEKETLVTLDLDPRDASSVRLAGTNLYFVVRPNSGQPRLSRFHIPTGELSVVSTLPSKSCLRVDISPDGTWIVFAEVDYGGGDIQLAQTNRL